MKKVWKVIYGLCVLYLMLHWIGYFGVVLYDGLQSVPDISISGGWVFLDGITTVVVLIVYPVKQYIQGMIRNIKKDMKERQKEKNKQKQTETTNK